METVIDFWAQTMSSSADGSNSFRDLVEFGGLYLGAPPGLGPTWGFDGWP